MLAGVGRRVHMTGGWQGSWRANEHNWISVFVFSEFHGLFYFGTCVFQLPWPPFLQDHHPAQHKVSQVLFDPPLAQVGEVDEKIHEAHAPAVVVMTAAAAAAAAANSMNRSTSHRGGCKLHVEITKPSTGFSAPNA